MRLTANITSHRNKARPLFESLRREILAGRFRANEKLPGSRALAHEFGVSRGTVNLVLAMLAAESLIKIFPGSGVFISAVPLARAKPPRVQRVQLSTWAKRLAPLEHRDPSVFFAPGRLADEYFPAVQWQRAVKDSHRNAGKMSSSLHTSAAGFSDLRKSIAAHLAYSRGLATAVDNIVIVNGSTQAIALIAQLLLDAKDCAAFEDPGFRGIRAAIHATGARGIACPLDGEGLILPEKPCRVLFVTPASQFPTGIRMSPARRAELMQFARQQNAFIVEDEYDSEFSRLPNAPQPLKLTDADDRVVYVGSFSRTMFASLRLGYCVLPDALVEPFLRARQLYDSVPPALSDQIAMASFMASGAYRLHIARMKKVYNERHRLLLAALQETLGIFFSFEPSAAGLSIFARWKKTRREFDLAAQRFTTNGIGWQSLDSYAAGRPPLAALFAFSHLNAQAIADLPGRLRRIDC